MNGLLKALGLVGALVVVLALAFGTKRVLSEPILQDDTVMVKKADVLAMFQQRMQMIAQMEEMERAIEEREREIAKLRIKLACS